MNEMPDFIDMSGRQIEHLQVLDQAPSRRGQAWWWVRCSACGHQFDERGAVDLFAEVA